MKNRFQKIIPYIWLGLIVLGLMTYMYFFFMNTCNDDASAEMILSNILSKEGGILSTDWIYSTELRVFNTQLVFSFLFHFITSWKWVRVIGNGLLYIAMIASTNYLCKTLNIKKYFPIVAAMMILPSSREYFEFAVHGTYLIPHLIISILSVALFIDVQYCTGKKRNIRLIILAILAFVAGLGGIRHILILYIPLLLVAIIQWVISKNKRQFLYVIYSIGELLVSLIGYLINSKILCVKYYGGTSSIGLYGKSIIYSDFHFSRLEEVINGWLKCYGFQVGKKVISVGLICNGLAALLILSAFLIVKRYKLSDEKTKLIIIIWGISSMVISALFIFTDMSFYPRYLFQAHIFLFPALACVCKEYDIDLKIKKIVVTIFALYITLVASYNLYEFIGENYTIGMRKAADILIDEGYDYGYSTSYWYWGNGMIEYSNGKLHTFRLTSDEDNNFYRMDWLEQVSLERYIPDQKVYVVTTNDYNADNYIEIVYEYEDKIVYGYESYEEMIKDFNLVYE